MLDINKISKYIINHQNEIIFDYFNHQNEFDDIKDIVTAKNVFLFQKIQRKNFKKRIIFLLEVINKILKNEGKVLIPTSLNVMNLPFVSILDKNTTIEEYVINDKIQFLEINKDNFDTFKSNLEYFISLSFAINYKPLLIFNLTDVIKNEQIKEYCLKQSLEICEQNLNSAKYHQENEHIINFENKKTKIIKILKDKNFDFEVLKDLSNFKSVKDMYLEDASFDTQLLENENDIIKKNLLKKYEQLFNNLNYFYQSYNILEIHTNLETLYLIKHYEEVEKLLNNDFENTIEKFFLHKENLESHFYVPIVDKIPEIFIKKISHMAIKDVINKYERLMYKNFTAFSCSKKYLNDLNKIKDLITTEFINFDDQKINENILSIAQFDFSQKIFEDIICLPNITKFINNNLITIKDNEIIIRGDLLTCISRGANYFIERYNREIFVDKKMPIFYKERNDKHYDWNIKNEYENIKNEILVEKIMSLIEMSSKIEKHNHKTAVQKINEFWNKTVRELNLLNEFKNENQAKKNKKKI